jgi:hypothetical protein
MTHLTIPIHPSPANMLPAPPRRGQSIRKSIPNSLAGRPVTLDFSGVAVFSAVFFNVAIAQLLKDIPPETLRDKLKIEGLSGHGMELLRKCLENAKGFYVPV